MTANQLQYQKNTEDRRHNEAMERLQQQSNTIANRQADASLTSAGASAAQAQVAAMRATEEARHNRAIEAYNQEKIFVDAWGSALKTAEVVTTIME